MGVTIATILPLIGLSSNLAREELGVFIHQIVTDRPFRLVFGHIGAAP
jgi:hypothetical protein